MTPDERTRLARALEEDGAWLHRLARGLARDPHTAADAAQAALLAAWEHAPGGRPPGRGWLATVLRNALRQEGRGAARRSAREERAARSEAVAPGHDALARLELQRKVVDALEALEEPYRGVLVLRFLDGLPPRAIAARTGAPVKTVYTRIERGLARLRERLDRDFEGGRSAWLGALVAVSPGAIGKPGLLAGASVMGSTIKAVAVASVLVAVVGVMRWQNGRTRSGGAEVAASTAGEAEPRAEPAPVAPAQEPAPELATPPRRGTVQTAVEGAAAARGPARDGVVVDVEGRPVEGVHVALRLERSAPGELASAVVESAVDGSVAVRLDDEAAPGPYDRPFLDCVDPAWVGLRRPIVEEDTGPVRLVVAPAHELGGSVVDGAGEPIAGAALVATVPLALERGLETEALAAENPTWETQSDAAGRFSLPRVPALEGVTLEAERGGYTPRTIAVGPEAGTDLVVRLLRLEPGETVATGRVLGPDGLPFGGALVAAGGKSMRSEPDGWFAVPIPQDWSFEDRWPLTLRAVAPGYLPAEHRLVAGATPPFVELRLGGPPLAIEGRVVGAREDPDELAGHVLYVWVNGIEPFGSTEVSGGGGTTYERFAFLEELTLDPQQDDPLRIAAGMTRTRDDGSFRIEGLRDATYTLFAIDNRTLAMAGPLEVRAGTEGATLQLVEDPPPVKVEGRVVDRHGAPVPGVSVSVSRPLHVDGFTVPGGPSARTDADGHFEFEPLSFDALQVAVRGTGARSKVADRYFDFGPDDVAGGLELVVGRYASLRVTTENPALAEATFLILDADDQALSIEHVEGNGRMMSGTATLAKGLSGVLQVDDRAAVLYVRVPEGEALRIPLDLSTDGVNDVRIP